MQSISQWQTKKQRNYKVNFMRDLNVLKNKNNVVVMPLKVCYCKKALIT